MDLIKIKIQNWSKFNPRADRANYTWFRFQNDFFHDEKIFSFNHEQIAVYLFLLCSASKKNSDQFEISLSYASAILKLKTKDILNYINDFKLLGMIAAFGRHDDGIHPAQLPATYIHNETNITDERTILPDLPTGQSRLVFDFDSLYKKYPRKEGKQRGIKICNSQIKTQDDFSQLSQAIDRYAEHIKKQATEAKFIKHFSTFMGEWRDWLDPDTGKVEEKKKEINWAYVFGEEENA